LGEKHLNRCICNFGFSGLAKSGYLLGKTHFSLTPGASKWSAAGGGGRGGPIKTKLEQERITRLLLY
jgi:hypothetical protein